VREAAKCGVLCAAASLETAIALADPACLGTKVFCFFFSKRKRFLFFLSFDFIPQADTNSGVPPMHQ
jgi:hypothetical protein